jgi:hypothetical protein
MGTFLANSAKPTGAIVMKSFTASIRDGTTAVAKSPIDD